MKLAGNRKIGLLLLAAAMTVAGCASPPEPTGTGGEFQEAYDHMLKDSGAPAGDGAPGESPSSVTVPPEVAEALLPKVGVDLSPHATQRGRDPTVDFILTQGGTLPARDLFLSLIEGTDYTMVVHPEVTNEVSLSLSLTNVTVPEAVETICQIYELDCRYSAPKKRFMIYPRRLTTRTFKIDQLPVVRSGRTETKVSSGQGSQSTSSSDSGTTTTGSAGAGASVSTEYSGDFWTELNATLREYLGLPTATASGGSGGQAAAPPAVAPATAVPNPAGQVEVNQKGVMINRQSGLVMVRALPDELRAVEEYMREVVERNNKQVLLEARILEVQLGDGFQYGLDWSAVGAQLGSTGSSSSSTSTTVDSDGVTISTTSGSSTDSGDNGSGESSTTGDYQVTDYTIDNWTSLISKQDGSPFSLALNIHDFIGFIKVLESQGKVQVLSSPRVSTANNQKALIKVGTDEIFMTDVAIIPPSDTQPVATTDPTFDQLFSGVAMDVMPQIGEDNVITLHIHPSVTEVQDKEKSFTFDGQENVYPLAYTQTRESDSVIRVRDGEVVVIGGLMKNEYKEETGTVPLLGDIPFVGKLLSSQNKSMVKSELVILLRPVIVTGRVTWQDEVGKSAQGIAELRHPERLWWMDKTDWTPWSTEKSENKQ